MSAFDDSSRGGDQLSDLVNRVRVAAADRTPLRIRGGGTKDFYGGMLAGELLEVGGHRGIIDYRPEELCLTARAGTPVAEIEGLLSEHDQMLPFEPPCFGPATIGGAIAAGLAGPWRCQAGSVRDSVLGVRMIDGRGEVLRFGGQVVKNVAGYDVPRLLAGSLGTLGVIADISLRLLPRPPAETTLWFEMEQGEAIQRLNRWAGQPWPISGSFWHRGRLALRLSGARPAVDAARRALGGEAMSSTLALAFWRDVREHHHDAFVGSQPLWRLSLPSATPPLPIADDFILEWNGAQRWLRGDDADDMRRAAAQAGGHATLFRAPESLRCRVGAFSPLPPALLVLHQRLKRVFDPARIFNPERLYVEV